MSPRHPAANEELRRRSCERLLQSTAEIVGAHGYETTTLHAVADRAGTARGLVSYYFPTKRHLLRAAAHRQLHLRISDALDRPPKAQPREAGVEELARLIDAVLLLAEEQPVLMRAHLATLLSEEGEDGRACPEKHRLDLLLHRALSAAGSTAPEADRATLRVLLLGAVLALVLPGAAAHRSLPRGEIFLRYQLPWRLGYPPADHPPRALT